MLVYSTAGVGRRQIKGPWTPVAGRVSKLEVRIYMIITGYLGHGNSIITSTLHALRSSNGNKLLTDPADT